MSRALDRLEELAAELSRRGDDAQRLELVQRARRFKRSWIDMAEALVWAQQQRVWERWGYGDIYEYCDQELQIKTTTVDKLTMSYTTVREHAPAVLERDGVGQPLPTVEAVEYFAKAVDPPEDSKYDPPTDDVVTELRQAVFDDAKPVASLRREFNKVLYPKPDGAEELELMEKARASARRLSNLLPAIEGLTKKRVKETSDLLDVLLGDLEGLIEDTKAEVYPDRAAS